MANYYNDIKEIKFELENSPLMERIVELKECGYADKDQYEEAPQDFADAMDANNLAEVEIKHDRVIYLTKEEAAKDPKEQKACFTGLPNGDVLQLARELKDSGVTVDYQILEDNSMIYMILYNLVTFAVLFGVMSMITKRMGDGGMGGFGGFPGF